MLPLANMSNPVSTQLIHPGIQGATMYILFNFYGWMNQETSAITHSPHWNDSDEPGFTWDPNLQYHCPWHPGICMRYIYCWLLLCILISLLFVDYLGDDDVSQEMDQTWEDQSVSSVCDTAGCVAIKLQANRSVLMTNREPTRRWFSLLLLMLLQAKQANVAKSNMGNLRHWSFTCTGGCTYLQYL